LPLPERYLSYSRFCSAYDRHPDSTATRLMIRPSRKNASNLSLNLGWINERSTWPPVVGIIDRYNALLAVVHPLVFAVVDNDLSSLVVIHAVNEVSVLKDPVPRRNDTAMV